MLLMLGRFTETDSASSFGGSLLATATQEELRHILQNSSQILNIEIVHRRL